MLGYFKVKATVCLTNIQLFFRTKLHEIHSCQDSLFLLSKSERTVFTRCHTGHGRIAYCYLVYNAKYVLKHVLIDVAVSDIAEILQLLMLNTNQSINCFRLEAL